MNNHTQTHKLDATRDPINGKPGAHTAGTGGVTAFRRLAANGGADAVNQTRENASLRKSFSLRDYFQTGSSFDNYGPADDLRVN